MTADGVRASSHGRGPCRVWRRALDGLWLLALAAYVLAGVRLTPFHGDESTLVFMSRDYHYLVQQRDLEAVLFNPDLVGDQWEEQQLRLLNGTVGKMAMGLAWDLAGFRVGDLNRGWYWGFVDPGGNWTEWTWNHAEGNVPGDRLLRAARLSSALLGVVAVWAVFAIAWLVAAGIDPRLARAAAWIASLAYATHPNVLLNARRAMMEGSLAAFAALTVLAGLMLMRAQRSPAPRPRALWGWTLALGLAAGTAIAAKHTALLVTLPTFAALTFRPGGRFWLTTDGRTLRRMIGGGLVMALVFLLWNPAWWRFDPMIPQKVVEWRGDLLEYLTESSRFYGLANEGALDRGRTLVNSLFWSGPQYAEVPQWYGWLAADIDRYESSGLAGRLGGPVWGALGLLLLIAGLVRARSSWRAGAVWLALIWGAALVIGLYGTPVKWERYYLPLQMPASVFVGVGAAWLWTLAGQALTRRIRPPVTE